MTGDAGLLRFLAQSDTRVAVLELLNERGGLDRYEIEQELDVSRRTVIRTIDALADNSYVVNETDTYELTALGATVAASYNEFASTVETAHQLEPFLAHLPDDSFNVDPRELDDAELLVASEASPYALIDRTISLRQETSHLRHMSPIIEKKSLEHLAQQLQHDDELTGDAIIPKQALDSWEDHPDYNDAYQHIINVDRLTLHVYPDTIPYMVCLTDDAVAVGVAKDGNPRAQLIADHPQLRQWATDTFENYLNQSKPLKQLKSGTEGL